MRSIRFGRIDGLQLRAGDPVNEPPPKTVREIKLACSDQQTCKSDYRRQPQITELLELFRQIGDGVVDVIEVRHGLPFRVVITDQPERKEA
jgi:hypothetical protein